MANLHSSADVEAFARSIGIAPGIVVGRLQHDGIIGFVALLLALLGPGDVGETATLGDGRTLRRLSDLHHRPYQSPFGEFDLPRFVYGTREGQAIELVPLDERLALPAGKFSYLLQEWDQSEVMEASFGQTSQIVKRILGLKQPVDSLEQMNRQVAGQVESYHASQAVPPAESDASLLVQTIDHKGVPIRPPADRSPIADHDAQSERRQDRKRMEDCPAADASASGTPP